MKKVFFVLLIACISGFSFGQATKDVVGQAFDKNGVGAKLVIPSKDVVAVKPDPARAQCCLNFDNYTGYWLQVWVDGTYRGNVAPWDEGGICVSEGWTTYYVRTTGSTYEWSGQGECRASINLLLE
jgi:hypothetical protein